MSVFYVLKKTVNTLANKRELRKTRCSMAQTVSINGRIKVYGTGEIVIGEGSRINSGEQYNPIGGADHTVFSLRNGGKIIIGKNVGISNSSFVSREEIIVEDDVRIGGNCKIYDNDFHSINYEIRVSDNDNDIKSAPIRIGKGAFIGAHTIILKGVTVGEHSVIGAGSVVAKSIPDGEVWAGNPARFIRKV